MRVCSPEVIQQLYTVRRRPRALKGSQTRLGRDASVPKDEAIPYMQFLPYPAAPIVMNWFTPEKPFYQEWDFWVSLGTLILVLVTAWVAIRRRRKPTCRRAVVWWRLNVGLGAMAPLRGRATKQAGWQE